MSIMEEKEFNTLSIVAFVFMFLIAPVGIILGIIALNQIKKTGEKGKNLASFAVFFPITLLIIGLIFFVIRLIIGA